MVNFVSLSDYLYFGKQKMFLYVIYSYKKFKRFCLYLIQWFLFILEVRLLYIIRNMFKFVYNLYNTTSRTILIQNLNLKNTE